MIKKTGARMGITLLIVVLQIVVVKGQSLSSQAIDSLVERARRAFEVPGMAVAIIKDGKVIHSKGYGFRSLATRQPVDENTLFGIASNTKAFTVAALGMLVDRKMLSWDDKVRKYIPEFQLFDPYVTEDFTIRDLLTHRSGMGLGAGDLMFFPDSSDFTIRDILHNLQFLKPVTGFRSQYAYDNNLYIVAGEVVARVSGMSYEDFIEKNILAPVGMRHSAASYDRLGDSSNVIDGHSKVDGTVRVIARSRSKVDHAAGGIYSSIADLSKWVMVQLGDGVLGSGSGAAQGAGGAGGGGRLFSSRVHQEMWSPQTIIRVGRPGPYNTHFAAYGLGFVLNDVKGYKQVSHTGGLEGMVTQITMIPELQLGIIVLTNQEEGGAFSAVTDQIKDSYFGIQGTDRVAEYAANRNRALMNEKKLLDSIDRSLEHARSAGAGARDLAIYMGTYRDPWLGEVVISMKNGRPWFDSKRSPKLTGELFPYKGNSFVVRWKDRSMKADAYVIFALDEEGKAVRMTMRPVSPLTDFSYDFQDLDLRRE